MDSITLFFLFTLSWLLMMFIYIIIKKYFLNKKKVSGLDNLLPKKSGVSFSISTDEGVRIHDSKVSIPLELILDKKFDIMDVIKKASSTISVEPIENEGKVISPNDISPKMAAEQKFGQKALVKEKDMPKDNQNNSSSSKEELVKLETVVEGDMNKYLPTESQIKEDEPEDLSDSLV